MSRDLRFYSFFLSLILRVDEWKKWNNNDKPTRFLRNDMLYTFQCITQSSKNPLPHHVFNCLGLNEIIGVR